MKDITNTRLTHPELCHSQDQETAAINRREFLKRAGRFAVYTPPALMLLMQPSYAKIARSGGQGGGDFIRLLQNNHSEYRNTLQPLLNKLFVKP